jgi:hypothetical protein
MAKVLISGASGFIGSSLCQFLSTLGHEVVRLERSFDKRDRAQFEGLDWVIHLAGEPLTLERWSRQKEKKIFDSRVLGTLFLSEILSKTVHAPKVFISASAIGYYGDRKEETLTEESSGGVGFLAEVCSAWEKASSEIEQRGARVVQTRFGMVIGANGGALKRMILPYKLGLGGKLGSGEQWVSWIDRDDLISALHHIAMNDSIAGCVNLVSPEPIRQKDFSAILAEVLHRPHFLSMPAWALRLAFGKVADELLLCSAKALPVKLLASNFAFQYADLRSALFKAIQNT